MGKLAIETRGLKKSFGKTHAVAGVDLAVSAGGVYGVLGPNGAGKTTTIRMLATLTGRSCLPHFSRRCLRKNHG
jgi:ABC-2 type transport system ATP-binding protein